VRFVNVNVADLDAVKHAGVGLVGDARATLEALDAALDGYEVEAAYREESGRRTPSGTPRCGVFTLWSTGRCRRRARS
jgi:TPP-dependent trihydroxycyclohexane-1,2-dione (THcHDO) dehydratase